MSRHLALIVGAGLLCSCGSTPAAKEAPASPAPTAAVQTPGPPPSSPSHKLTPSSPRVATEPAVPAGLREVFPGVRVDAASKIMEFDGTVPIDCHNEKTPVVFLEVIVCTPDTKEHESLVMTRVKPSHVHAALLMLGLEPGRVGVWNWDGPQLRAVPPSGPRVTVTFTYERDGRRVSATPQDWVLNIRDRRTLTEHGGHDGWVFSGSSIVTRQGQEWYHADREGCLIGLTCFSNETVSWTRMFSPDSGVHEPVWIGNAATVPAFGTPVTVTIRPE